MARKKLTVTKDVQKAEGRMNGSKSIDPALDWGNGLTIAAFEALTAAHHGVIADANETLSLLDQKSNIIKASDKTVKVFSER